MFNTLDSRSKLRRTASLRQSFNSDELIFAASSRLYTEGKRSNSKGIQNENTSQNSKTQNPIKSFSPEQALNLMVEAKLSVNQYCLLRTSALNQNANLYPAYWQIKQAKSLCYPPADKIKITDSYAEVDLLSLLNHTANRLFLAINPVIDSLEMSPNDNINFKLISKWRSDGSSGYSMYKQLSLDPSLDDSSLYATSVVPIQMFYMKNHKKIIVWQNPRTSSPRYCRPIKLHFVKETKHQILEQTKLIQDQIDNLQPTNVTYRGHTFNVHHDLHLTMVDLKFCIAVTDTKSAQVCYICGCKPSQMNNLDLIKNMTLNKEALKFGISSLHCYLRTFEYLLHIAYKLELKKYQTKEKSEKDALNCRKLLIQKEFKTQLGLTVDMPKQGFGTSNDGNTARQFFKNAEISSEITGIELTVIQRFSTILSVISSGYEINLEMFNTFLLETAKLVISLYSWYIMPPTVHKLLMHGSAIIKTAPLPIGMLSEDAQASQHKKSKYIRTFHTRKFSRKESNADLLHMCLIRSDPYITSMRMLPKKFGTHLDSSAIDFLKEPNSSYVCEVEPTELGDLSQEEFD